jgi:hypothetical protein
VNALVKSNVRSLVQLVERAGPYLLLELLLPGGTLFALLLFVYRNRPLRARIDAAARTPIIVARVIEGAKRIALLPDDIQSISKPA